MTSLTINEILDTFYEFWNKYDTEIGRSQVDTLCPFAAALAENETDCDDFCFKFQEFTEGNPDRKCPCQAFGESHAFQLLTEVLDYSEGDFVELHDEFDVVGIDPKPYPNKEE